MCKIKRIGRLPLQGITFFFLYFDLIMRIADYLTVVCGIMLFQ